MAIWKARNAQLSLSRTQHDRIWLYEREIIVCSGCQSTCFIMKLSLLFISVLHLLHAFSLWLYVSVWALQIPFFVLFSRESEVPVCLKTRRVSQGYIRPCEFYVDLNIVSYLVLKQDLWEEVVSSIVVTTRFCG